MINIDFTTKIELIPGYKIDKWGDKYLRDQNGKLHSYNDLPSIIMKYGSKVWFKHGKLHRDKGLPAIVWVNGVKSFYENNKLIRNEPA